MKKYIAIVLVLVTVFALTACSGTTSSTQSATAPAASASSAAPASSSAPAASKAPAATPSAAASGTKPIVAVCLGSLDNPLMIGIGDAVKKNLGSLADVQIASADSDPNKQATQIQNYIAMGVKEILTMPVESSSLTDVLKAAHDKGILVAVCGTQMDAACYDTMATVNQYLLGCYCALMTKNWITANYPNAAPGSLPAAALTSSLNQDAVARTKGLLSITEQYLKNADGKYVDVKGNVTDESKKVENPAYCAAVKMVKTTDAEMFQAGQTAMQNILTTNPEVRIVLAYAGDGGCGASQAIMDKGIASGDLAKYAIFGCGVIGSEADYIKDSGAGKSVFRGSVAFGGADLPGEMGQLALDLFNGKAVKDKWDPISLVYWKNNDVVRLPVNNVGTVTATQQ